MPTVKQKALLRKCNQWTVSHVAEDVMRKCIVKNVYKYTLCLSRLCEKMALISGNMDKHTP